MNVTLKIHLNAEFYRENFGEMTMPELQKQLVNELQDALKNVETKRIVMMMHRSKQCEFYQELEA